MEKKKKYHKPIRSDLGRMTEDEYAKLNQKHKPRGKKKAKELGRMTEEEYIVMWGGCPPPEVF